MPSVAVLPNNPGPGLGGGFGSSHATNRSITSPVYNEMTVAEIKAKAKESVLKEGKGVSAISLIKIARSQLLNAKEYEAKGDLTSALASYIKGASLLKMAIDSTEFKQDRGAIRYEWEAFLETDGKDLAARTKAVEEKLKAIESTDAERERNEPPAVKSIADRVRALQGNGLSVATSKRFSKEVTSLPTPPTPPACITPTPITSILPGPQVLSTPGPPVPSTPITSAIVPGSSIPSTPLTPTVVPGSSIPPSPHTLVSPNSFGPSSPSSSPSSSPQLDLSGFRQNFPSIDELDERFASNLPSAPTAPSADPSAHIDAQTSPAPFRNFAMHIERPASTPIPPTGNAFVSRPASPTKPVNPPRSSPLSSNRTPLPVTTFATPKELSRYIREYKVLVIDARNREDFEREHIQAPAVVCIEPVVLNREGVNCETLENSMVVAPRTESSLFENRDKFELVAVYDQSSTSFGKTPLTTLSTIIGQPGIRKMLKRAPMMLVGGLDAWKRELNGEGLVRGDGDQRNPNAQPNNIYTNGTHSPHLPGAGASSSSDPHQVWTPPSRSDAPGPSENTNEARHLFSPDISGHARSPADYTHSSHNGISQLSRRPAMARPGSSSISYSRSKNDYSPSPLASSPRLNGVPSSGSIVYPSVARRISPTASGSSNQPSVLPSSQFEIVSPPQASINPSQLSRRRSDYVDQSQEALSFLHNRPAIDYPELTSTSIIRPPPVAASSTMERQDNRPRIHQPMPSISQPPTIPGGPPAPPRIASDYPVTYWPDLQIGTSGLKNLGNTCYMNAPIQCLSATVPFARFFTEGRWKNAINFMNPMGSKGHLVHAFAKLVHEMWGGDLPYLTPIDFRRSICQLKSQYIGSDQHDSQEFLSFLLDGMHEDLNRVIHRPEIKVTPEQEAELERLPAPIASDREWRSWLTRNDSLIVDFFQGQFRSRLQCLTCKKTSTTYNVFSILQLPIPHSRSSKVHIDKCLAALFNEEVLEKDDAWDCPQCKTKRRASKTLSLARLPPVLLIHLKRFEANGRFSDKIDTFVDYPMKGLDLTNYMPPPLPPGADKSGLNGGLPMSPDDPRTQLPPYRYDLYAVTNHYGNLSSGHYTAFIASKGGWMYCDDSTVKPTDPRQVVNQKAYVLFYKRVRA